mgnify:CR=1 FL=1
MGPIVPLPLPGVNEAATRPCLLSPATDSAPEALHYVRSSAILSVQGNLRANFLRVGYVAHSLLITEVRGTGRMAREKQ